MGFYGGKIACRVDLPEDASLSDLSSLREKRRDFFIVNLISFSRRPNDSMTNDKRHNSISLFLIAYDTMPTRLFTFSFSNSVSR
jgi:hypothetical protein